MKAMEIGSYMDFCQILDTFLEKVERKNKEIQALKLKQKSE